MVNVLSCLLSAQFVFNLHLRSQENPYAPQLISKRYPYDIDPQISPKLVWLITECRRPLRVELYPLSFLHYPSPDSQCCDEQKTRMCLKPLSTPDMLNYRPVLMSVCSTGLLMETKYACFKQSVFVFMTEKNNLN